MLHENFLGPFFHGRRPAIRASNFAPKLVARDFLSGYDHEIKILERQILLPKTDRARIICRLTIANADMSKRLITVSKFLSKYLRHEPEVLGLSLEPGGWVLVDDVLAGAARQGFEISKEELFQVVAENDKQRFSFDETRTKIRANQGHSTKVDLQLTETVPPEQLFHGTVSKFLGAIRKEGLKKMARHDVHLSKDMETALKVGGRRGKPVVLVIDSGDMAADGYKFRFFVEFSGYLRAV